MTIQARNRAVTAAVLIGIAALAATLLPTFATSGIGGVREIRLVARDMTFYLDGDDQPNPTLTVRAGERVRIVIRNEDAGMRHDFVIDDWSIASRLLEEERGAQASMTITVPAHRGVHTYHCTPHQQMMRGTVRVE